MLLCVGSCHACTLSFTMLPMTRRLLPLSSLHSLGKSISYLPFSHFFLCSLYTFGGWKTLAVTNSCDTFRPFVRVRACKHPDLYVKFAKLFVMLVLQECRQGNGQRLFFVENVCVRKTKTSRIRVRSCMKMSRTLSRKLRKSDKTFNWKHRKGEYLLQGIYPEHAI